MSSILLKKLPPEYDFSLFDVDASRLPPGLYPHRHDYYEVIWFHSGGGSNVIDFVSHSIKARRIFFMAPGQVHELRGKRSRGTFIAFGRGFVAKVQSASGVDVDTALFHSFDQPPFVDVARADGEPLRQLMELMRTEHQREASSWAILQALLSSFLLSALRIKGSGTTRKGSAPTERIALLRQTIEASYLEERNAAFYARAVGLTPKRINELTRDALGKTVTQLLTDRIILQAKRDLHFTTKSVKEIAHALAYDDPAYFSRFFKRHTGMTPGAFRASR